MHNIQKLSAYIFTILTLASCSQNSQTQPPQQTYGAIIPHHLLVEKHIDQFYSEISDPKIEKIILLSPNHFGLGFSYIQSTDKTYEKNDINLDLEKIFALSKTNFLAIESADFDKEHGIYTHAPFIKKYFPNAKITPIIIKSGAPQKILDTLIAAISQNFEKNQTMIIASVDFTHYTAENFASKNDKNTIAFLQNPQPLTLETIKNLAVPLAKTNPDATAIDSPESIYVLLKLMAKQNTRFTLWKRTSTATVTSIQDPDLNTSHIFGRFKKP